MKGKTLLDQLSAMNSGNTYVNIQTVNIQTDKYPDEVRGQLKLSGSNSTALTGSCDASNMTSDNK